MRILLIEDNSDLAGNIVDYLETQSFSVDYAFNGKLGLKLALEHHFDVIVLDLMLPGLDGISLAKALREDHNSATPIIMLTGRDTLDNKLEGFEAGADDYLVKPFELKELVARITVLGRRKTASPASNQLTVDDLSFNLSTQQILRGDKLITLKPVARRVLELLMRNQQRVVSRMEIEQHIWGDQPPDSEAVRVHLHNIRHAIDRAELPTLVHTIRGSGYRIARLD